MILWKVSLSSDIQSGEVKKNVEEIKKSQTRRDRCHSGRRFKAVVKGGGVVVVHARLRVRTGY